MTVNNAIIAAMQEAVALREASGNHYGGFSAQQIAEIFARPLGWARYHLNQMVKRGELWKIRHRPNGCIQKCRYMLKVGKK